MLAHDRSYRKSITTERFGSGESCPCDGKELSFPGKPGEKRGVGSSQPNLSAESAYLAIECLTMVPIEMRWDFV